MSRTYRFTGVVRSTVCVLKDGRLREIRRGDLTGAALLSARTWETVAAWRDDMLVADPEGKFCAATPTLPPLDCIAFIPSTPPWPRPLPPSIHTVDRIRQMLDECATAPFSEKPAIATRLMAYILEEPDVVPMIRDYPVFGDVVRRKCHELIQSTNATPALIAICGAVLGRWWPAELTVLVVPAPAPAAPAVAAPAPAAPAVAAPAPAAPAVASPAPAPAAPAVAAPASVKIQSSTTGLYIGVPTHRRGTAYDSCVSPTEVAATEIYFSPVRGLGPECIHIAAGGRFGPMMYGRVVDGTPIVDWTTCGGAIRHDSIWIREPLEGRPGFTLRWSPMGNTRAQSSARAARFYLAIAHGELILSSEPHVFVCV